LFEQFDIHGCIILFDLSDEYWSKRNTDESIDTVNLAKKKNDKEYPYVLCATYDIPDVDYTAAKVIMNFFRF
jgi:hypothetical protein